jgi:predicted amidophosphoribosyltransferase
MEKFCPNDCVGIFKPEDKFCYTCGAKLENWNETCKCGQKLSIHDHFCPACGKPVDNSGEDL